MSSPYAEVIGDPISHSKSPLTHNFWLKKLGLTARYDAVQVSSAALPAYLASRRTDPYWRGCNVTMPLKSAVIALADEVDAETKSIAAANLLFRSGDGLAALNTDVDGILQALPWPALSGNQRVCIIGSGGAARAALSACQRRGIGTVLISARNENAGWHLLREFGFQGTSRTLADQHNIQNAHVIINATPLGMTGGSPMPPSVLQNVRGLPSETVVFDMVYAPPETELVRVAAEAGCRVVSGLEMLVGQASASFEKLFGAPAPREHDRELRELLMR
jgi:shikimate dehydrogenase